jgi:hypothetical protein
MKENDIKFHIDLIEAELIKGWAFKEGSGSARRISICINDEIRVETRADVYRKILHESGKHASGNCGFSIRFEKELKRGDKIEVLDSTEADEFLEPVLLKRTEFMPKKTKLFLMHIAKTGGTSVNSWLISSLGPDRCRAHLESRSNWENNNLDKEHDFLSGHIRLKAAKRLMNLDRFYTAAVFRDPIEHLASHLCWVKYIGADSKSEFFKSHQRDIQKLALQIQSVDFSKPVELKEFLNSTNPTMNNLFDNCQLRYLLSEELQGRVGYDELLMAKRTLDEIDVIGVTEHLDSFVARVGELMKISYPESTPNRNAQGNRFGLDVLNGDTIRAMLPFTQFDSIIYQLANDHSK